MITTVKRAPAPVEAITLTMSPVELIFLAVLHWREADGYNGPDCERETTGAGLYKAFEEAYGVDINTALGYSDKAGTIQAQTDAVSAWLATREEATI